MKTIEIKGNLRKETGKGDSRRLRKAKKVPCVMYGGEENIHFTTDELAFKDLIYSPHIYLVKLNLDGKIYDASLKDIQYHPVSDSIIHCDFIQIFEDKPVIINIPIHIFGESEGLKAGGKMRVKRRKLKVKGLIKDLPDQLDVDITKLNIGQTIKVGDLSYDNLELLDPHQSMVISIVSSRVAAKGMTIEESEGEEGAEDEEGAETEGGEGAESPEASE